MFVEGDLGVAVGEAGSIGDDGEEARRVTQVAENPSKPLGSIWIDCDSNSVVAVGLKRALEGTARVRVGKHPQGEALSSILLCSDDVESVAESVRRVQEISPDVPVLVFGLKTDLRLARSALRAGARGFVHAGMSSEQIVRAVEVAVEGEIVAPRKLLEYLLSNDEHADLGALSARQREILGLVVEGLSNAEIGKRLYLSESTVKQHLRAAYKLLGVSNRTEAARLVRDDR
jgi:DNA-binding NarL/FixJ family response regulator